MTGIPETLKVGGIVYSVEFVDEPNEMDPSSDGNIFFSKQTIRIKKGLAPDYTNKIFMHELLHAITEYCDIRLADDEHTIEQLAQALYQVFKDNDINFRGQWTDNYAKAARGWDEVLADSLKRIEEGEAKKNG